MRYKGRIDREPVFVRLGVIIGRGREVHDNCVARADIVVRMPNEFRDIDQSAMMLAQGDLADLAACRRVRAHVIHDEFQFALQNAVSIFMQLVQVPALYHARPDGEAVCGYQRI